MKKEHYTLDWHRFNLKRRIKGAGVLSEEDFQNKTQEGDVSSISGSDSESSDEEDSRTSLESSLESSLDLGHPNRSQRVLFRNGQGKLLSVYRCVLGVTKDMEVSPEQLLSCVKCLQDQPTVVILMAGGGHFAGTVFKGKEVFKHKTFHRYTVRAKRGTSQSVHDSQNRSHMAKSAGASLRRYNQAALMAIPGPISEEAEARRAEKKKAQKSLRKQKEKEEKEERLRREAEEAEKKRFAAMSDREK
ncbi:hypothetical protein AB205_0013470, partial [Aquarana catesbeiana]